ncbi:MAG: DUF2125 domain-containing protein [Alphaproteobacteria bacterium]|nr:DUF2125 domain-containing protein [Alphaproteobacteria bacterium]
MKYSSRFFLYAPIAVFLLIAAVASVIWWREANTLSARLDAMNGREAMPGVTVSFKSKTVSGFPFNLDVTFADLRATVKTPHGPTVWTTEKFALHALTYGREQMIFEAAGRQALNWVQLDGKTRGLPFEVGELHASAISTERGVSRVDVVLLGFGSPALTAGKIELHARVAPNGSAVEVAALAESVHLSPPLRSAFGPDIVTARMTASATPPRAFDGLRAGRTDWVSAVETWRKAGGVLRIDDAEVAWPEVSAHGKGQLVLNDKHAVSGALDFKVAGLTKFVEQATLRGMKGDSFRGIGPALLARAAKAGANDAGLLGAVVTFDAGVVALGDTPATTAEPLY